MKANLLSFIRGLKNGTPPRFQSYLKSLTLLLVMLMSVNLMAEDSSVSISSFSTSGKIGNIFGYSITKNSGTNDPYTTGGNLRMYWDSSKGSKGNLFTITVPDGYTITKVVITATNTSYTPPVKYNVDGGSDQSGSWSSTTMTISSISAKESFAFRNAGTENNTQLRPSKVQVFYTESADCSNKVTVTKNAATNGSYTLKAGSATGSEISNGGTVDNCDANATIVVIPKANTHYHCTGVTASNSASVTGPDGSGNYTITYTKSSSINSSISVTFAENTKYTVNWYANGQLKGTQTNYSGTICTAPTTPTTSDCDGSKVFVGWTTSQNYESENIAPSDLFTDPTTKTIPDGGANYYAVFANESISGKGIAQVVDNSFAGNYTSYCNMTYGLKTAGTHYVQKNSIWSGLTTETIKINIKHISNTSADVLTVSLIDKDGNNVVSTDVTTQTISSSKDDASYLTNPISLTATSAVTGYKIKLKTKNGYGTCIGEVSRVVEAAITRTNYATTCAPIFNISSSITGQGSILWSLDLDNWSSTIADQPADRDVYFKLVPDAGYEVQEESINITSTEEVLWEPVEGEANTYYMIMPAAAVTVSATFSCATPTFKTDLSTEKVVYTQNHNATALSVAANETYTINYQWQSSTDNTNWSNIGTNSANYTPSTETAGTTYYRCLLKNGVGTCETYATSSVATIQVDAPSVCEDPVIELASGDYIGAKSATITCMREGATIYYTTNGDDPTASSTEYTGPVTIDRDMTLKAIAVKSGLTNSGIVSATYTIKYTVTFNMQGLGQQVADQKVGYEGFVEQPATTSITGWTFGGWFKEGACNNQWNFATDKITGHTTLYAKWTMTKFDVNFYVNGNPTPVSIQEGEKVKDHLPPTPAAFDQDFPNFVGWAESPITGIAPNTPTLITNETVTGTADYYAVFGDAKLSNTYTFYEGTTIPDGNYLIAGYASSTDFLMKNVLTGDYYIAVDEQSGSNDSYTNPAAANIWQLTTTDDGTTIYNASAKKYIEMYANGTHRNLRLSENPSYFTVALNDKAVCTILSKSYSGYYVAFVYGTFDEFAAKQVSDIYYNTYLFKQDVETTGYITNKTNRVTLHYDANAGTEVIADVPENARINKNELFTLPTDKLTRIGYTHLGWNESSTATEAQATITPTEDVTVYAVWQVNSYTLTWELNGGTVTEAGTAAGSVVYATELTAPVLEKTGYTYTWDPAVPATMPASNSTYSAIWTAEKYDINYKDENDAAFSGSTAGLPTKHTYGTTTTLVNSSRTGYEFNGWFTDAACTNPISTLGATDYTASITLYAKWSEIMPTEIKVSSSEVSLIVAGSDSEKSKKITATVEPSTALNKNIAWSVVEGNDVVSVSSEGIITSLKAGTATVRATSSRDANIYEEISVTVHSLPQITWLNMDGSTYASTNGTSAGKVGALPTGTPTSCDATAYPYFRGWSAENFGKTNDNPETDFITVNTLVELDKKYTFHAVCAAGKEEIQTVFTETFDQCEGTGGNDDQWSGNIASSTLTTDNTGWTYSSGNGGSKCAKFGGSSSKGSAETPSITMSGDGTIILKAAAWNTSDEKTTLNISTTSGTVNPTSVTLKKAKWSEYEISITGVTTATKIKFEANAKNSNRFFIDNVVVKANAITYTTWATQCCTTPESPLEITNTNLTVKTGGTLELYTTEGIKGATKVWNSLNGAVATVNSEGVVTAESTGKAIITVSQEAKDGYCAQYDEVEIEVIAANEFGISFTAAEGGSVVAKVNDTQTYKATTGKTVTIIATPEDDYNFTGWTVNAGGVTLADASSATTTFTMGEADVEITPSFAIKQYMVTLDAGTGTVETDSYTEDAHTQVTLPAAAHCQSDVWVFQGWSETNLTAAASECPALVDNNYEITKDVTLYAIYKKADGGEKTIGYRIYSNFGGSTKYYVSGVPNQQKMPSTTTVANASIFTIDNVDGTATNIVFRSGTKYLYIDGSGNLTTATNQPTSGKVKKWSVTSSGISSADETNQRSLSGRYNSNPVTYEFKDCSVDAIGTTNGNYTYYAVAIEPVIEGAASYHTSPECVSLTWVNGMSDEQFVTYPVDGKIVLPTVTPTSCAPGLYSFVGWTTTEIETYKTSQQEIVTAEMAAPEHATTYYAEFVNTAGNRYRTSCPETLYAITYKANGGEGEDYIQYSENKTNVISYDGAAFSKTDCQLYQWNTVSDGTGTAYKPNNNINSIATIVGEGTTGTLYAQWTGDLSVAGNVCLTSGKDIAVYTTAAAGNLITISCPAIDMVHHIRYKFLDSENNQVSALKLCNNGTDNFNQLTNIATDGIVGAYEQTFSICYTPTEYNQSATYTLLLEGVDQGGNTIFNSCSLSVAVRSLPEQFVIAIKKDNQWYAVPNVLGTSSSETAPEALTINVDDANNPTYAILSDNTAKALYKSAERYQSTNHRGAIRLQSVANNKYITASYAKDATSFYMPDGNSDAQQFYLNSTNCNVYKVTLDPAEFVDKDYESRWICMYGTKIGWYRYDNETKNVYFLPIKTITEKIEVNDGKTESLSKYEVDENTTIIVHAGGTLNADKVATIGTLQIERKDGKSGQVIETKTLTANNAYFDVTLNAAGMKWYDIAVPFEVDRLNGLSFPDGGDFPLNDVLVYSGAARAQNGANGSAWQYQDDGDLNPGVGYDIMFASNVTTVRFTKKAGEKLNNEGDLAVSEFVSANPLDANWNYVANNSLHYVNLGFGDDGNSGVVAQTYNPEFDSYTPYTQTGATYLVGTPFFVQVDAADKVVWNIDETHSVLRAPAMTMNRVDRFTLEMSANGEMTDRLFVSADENARDEYQIGKDVAKMGVSSTIAQMWINNYNTKLCANEAVLTNGQATYQLGVFVPKDGEYTIAITSAPENATLYLTIDGQVVWNLSESAYVANLTKGTHSEFGLLLIANEKVTPTNINGLKGNNKAQKIFKDYNIYILRDAQMYNTQGVKVQ